MASEAQILANRRNAEKSTGPRTEEGKVASSQNAVKHGLLAARNVISSEDPDEFDCHRQLMLAQLDPAGPIERVLAERIVSLSWRLKRVERMQNEALDCLMGEDVARSEGEAGELGSFVQADDLTLGRAAVKDFGNERVLERLMVYERRIEHSLYRTMNELHRMKLLRPFDRDDRVRRPDSPGPDQPRETNPIPGAPAAAGWWPAGRQSHGPDALLSTQRAGTPVLIDAERGDRYRGSPDR
jgi:hypothetical protein